MKNIDSKIIPMSEMTSVCPQNTWDQCDVNHPSNSLLDTLQ